MLFRLKTLKDNFHKAHFLSGGLVPTQSDWFYKNNKHLILLLVCQEFLLQ